MLKKLLFILFCPFLIHAQEVSHEHAVRSNFIENKGQWDQDILFKSKFSGGNLWIQQNKFLFHIQDYSASILAHGGGEIDTSIHNRHTVVHMNIEGSQKVTRILKKKPSSTYNNYFLGNDETKWASDVHGYEEAVLKEIYEGIDLRLIDEKEKLKYEFHVSPNVDPDLISLEFVGQNELMIDEKGNLNIKTDLGNIMEEAPYAYQIVNGNIREVRCNFMIIDNIVSFDLGVYDPNVALVIDPVLVFATYCGSPTDNFGMTATYGYDGTAYSGGMIYGNNYPTPDNGVYDPNSNFSGANSAEDGITDVFISKYSPDGTTMLWTTFIGGGNDSQGTETVHSLICDKANNVFLYGATSSIDFPIQNGFQPVHGGGVTGANFGSNNVYFTDQGSDIFVAKLSSNGHDLLGSTYMGGTGNDGVNYGSLLNHNYGDLFRGEVMLDENENCIVASCTRSTDFPVLNEFQTNNKGGQDGIIFKVSSDVSTLLWSSYYGGTEDDACYSVKVDSSYHLVVSGGTISTDLDSLAQGWQGSFNGGDADGFVLRMKPDGSSLMGGTYIGTSGYDQSFFVEINRNNEVFLIGQSEGLFPINNALYADSGSGHFLLKLDSAMQINENSTVFGNGTTSKLISPSAFLVDICGNLYVSGWGSTFTESGLNNLPTTSDAYQASAPNGHDFYLFVLDRNFDSLIYATYMGGALAYEHVDGGTSRFDKNGVIYQSVCGGCRYPGTTPHSDFPTTTGAWSSTNDSPNCNNLLFKFDMEIIPRAEFTVNDQTICVGQPFFLTNNSSTSDHYLWIFDNGDTSYVYDPVVTFDQAGTYKVRLYVTDSVCLLTDSMFINVYVEEPFDLNVPDNVFQCSPDSLILWAETGGGAEDFVWSFKDDFSDTLNENLLKDTLIVLPPGDTTYYIHASNDYCSQIDSIKTVFVSSALQLSNEIEGCAGDDITIVSTNIKPEIAFTYDWSPKEIIVGPTNTPIITINTNSDVWVYILADDQNGCQFYDSIEVLLTDIDVLLVDALVSDSVVAIGDEVTLTAEPDGYEYLWSPSNSVKGKKKQVATSKVEEDTWYYLMVTDGTCIREDSVLVRAFEFDCDEPFIYVPNAFSPNSDGKNDVLYVRSRVTTEILFRVFNRWGELVFESQDLDLGWDGKVNGKLLPPDVYDYYLKAKCIGEVENEFKGNVTLMR